MVVNREEHNQAAPDNPVTSVRHLAQHSDGRCLGRTVWIWCPGCQAVHMPRFRCPDHGGPTEGPVWDGDPYSTPFTMSPSLLVHETAIGPRCHSFIENDHWRYLSDCTHALKDQTVPLEPLPDWVIKEVSED